MRVSADQGVGVSLSRTVGVGVENHAAQVFEVDLVNDAGVGRHDFEVAEGGLAPAQEGVALAVAREFNLVVGSQSSGSAVLIDLHRVVDHELGGRQRVDSLRVAAQLHDRIAHCGEVDDTGYAGKVLKDYSRRSEGDLV